MRDHPFSYIYTINGLSWDLESNTSRQPETSQPRVLGQVVVSIISGLSIGRLLTPVDGAVPVFFFCWLVVGCCY